MPISKYAIAAGVGALAGGYIGTGRAAEHPEFGLEERAGYTVMSGIVGATAGAAALYTHRKVLGATGAAYRGARTMGRLMMKRPIGAAASKIGLKVGWSNTPKLIKGGLGAMALMALSVGAVAMGERVPPQSTSYAAPTPYGETQYDSAPMGQSLNERMSLMGATGEMVFGLNNKRHG